MLFNAHLFQYHLPVVPGRPLPNEQGCRNLTAPTDGNSVRPQHGDF